MCRKLSTKSLIFKQVFTFVNAAVLCCAALFAPVCADAAEAERTVPVFYYAFNDDLILTLKDDAEAIEDQYPFKLAHIDCKGSAAVQLAKVREYLNKGGKGPLLVNLVDPKGSEVVTHAIRRSRTPVVFFNRRPSASLMHSIGEAWYVGVSPERTGRLQAEILIDYLKINPQADVNGDGQLNTVFFKGEFSHEDTDLRSVAFLGRVRAESVKLNMVLIKNANWKRETAYEQLKSFLAKNKVPLIELVVANNDSMALGALKALQEKGYNLGDPEKYIPILGIDGLKAMREKIKAGECLGTVTYDTREMARVMLDLTQKILEGQSPAGSIDGQKIRADRSLFLKSRQVSFFAP